MRPFRSAVVVLGSLATLALAPPARAYCRTTVGPIPASYNPVDEGCIGGTPLWWSAMPVAYSVYSGASSQIDLAQATTVIDRSFEKWSLATCGASGADGNPALTIVDQGATDASDPCGDSPTCTLPQNTRSAIYFRDGSWPYDDAANTIALTTVSFGVDDGRIFSSIMELNSHDHTFTPTLPAPAGDYSLEAVVTHEAGHFVGMAHSADQQAIMYAYYQPDAIALTADDAAGICTIYPPATPASGCAASPRSATGDAAVGLGLVGLVTALARKRRAARVA